MLTRTKEAVRRVLPKNAFARSVTVLVGGAAASQFVLLLAAPILTRLYKPEDFGLLAVYVALLAILLVVASFRYELAIPLPENDEEAANVAALSLIVVAGTTLFSAFIMLFFGASLARELGAPQLAGYTWLLPLGVLLGGIYSVFNYWAIRTKRFPVLAGTKLRQALATITLQIAAFKLGGVALLFGHAAGQGVGAAKLSQMAISSPAFKKITLRAVVQAATRYRRFPLFTTWSGALNTAGTHLPPVLLAALFSPSAAGLYWLAQRALTMPMNLVGTAVGNVFFSHAADANRKGTLGVLVRAVHDRLAHLAVPPLLVLLLAGPDLFALVFGPEWRQAGGFAQWMAPWLYLAFISSPISTLVSILERQAQGLIFQIILLVMRVIGLMVGAYYQNITLAIALFSIGSALCYLFFILWLMRSAGQKLEIFIASTRRAMIWGAVVVSPLILATSVDVSGTVWVSAFVATLMFSLLYYIGMARHFS